MVWGKNNNNAALVKFALSPGKRKGAYVKWQVYRGRPLVWQQNCSFVWQICVKSRKEERNTHAQFFGMGQLYRGRPLGWGRNNKISVLAKFALSPGKRKGAHVHIFVRMGELYWGCPLVGAEPAEVQFWQNLREVQESETEHMCTLL